MEWRTNLGNSLTEWICKKYKLKYEIKNIITEPSNTGTHFLVYGSDRDNEGVLISLDFSTMLESKC